MPRAFRSAKKIVGPGPAFNPILAPTDATPPFLAFRHLADSAVQRLVAELAFRPDARAAPLTLRAAITLVDLPVSNHCALSCYDPALLNSKQAMQTQDREHHGGGKQQWRGGPARPGLDKAGGNRQERGASEIPKLENANAWSPIFGMQHQGRQR
jgi:hypothetical protein